MCTFFHVCFFICSSSKWLTGRPRAICGQRYPLPCFAWLWIGMRGSKEVALIGMKSCRTQGDFCLFVVCLSIHQSPPGPLRPEISPLRPEISPPVFYRTSFPSEPLPCFPHSDSQPCKAGQWVSLTTYCPWATCCMVSVSTLVLNEPYQIWWATQLSLFYQLCFMSLVLSTLPLWFGLQKILN